MKELKDLTFEEIIDKMIYIAEQNPWIIKDTKEYLLQLKMELKRRYYGIKKNT